MKFQSPHKKPVTVDETVLWADLNNKIESFPTPNQELLPGIKWGYYSQLFTPAYWKIQYIMHNHNDNFSINYRLGDNILEEVVACLLGGFGLKSEIGLAAFDRLKQRNQIKKGISISALTASLQESFRIQDRNVHYRFPNQKAKFISQFLGRQDLDVIPTNNDIDFRDWLLSINGIGPKTASWITRNYLDSENVAIIDIHIFRACLVMGLYTESLDVQKDYFKLEKIFLQFCRELEVQPSKMDALMWLQMKESHRTALKVIKNQ